MSHVPAKISTTPAHRRWPKATRPAARKVSPRPTTVTWLGVIGLRPSADTSASAWRRTQASNRVVNTGHLQCCRRSCGECLTRLLVDLDDLRCDKLPRVASGLLNRVVGRSEEHTSELRHRCTSYA